MFVNTPLEDCIRRDAARPNPVGEKVIREMHAKYLADNATILSSMRVDPTAVYVPPVGKHPAVIVDIDGTLAHRVDRSPFDWKRVGEDKADPMVKTLVNDIFRDYVVLLVSGRDEVCRAETKDWLKRHHIRHSELFMRPQGDTRNDAIVKREIFDKHIRTEFDVKFVLDDRDRVVKMWRSLGLKCLQVAEGNF